MRKVPITAILVPAALAALAVPASAAQPTEPSCFGMDVSTYAQEGFTVLGEEIEAGSGFGHFHYWFAQEVFHGMDDAVHLHQAGAVPPGAVSPYTCGS